MQTRFILLLLQAPLVLRGYEINSEIEHARTRDSANTAAKPSYESGNGGRGSGEYDKGGSVSEHGLCARAAASPARTDAACSPPWSLFNTSSAIFS